MIWIVFQEASYAIDDKPPFAWPYLIRDACTKSADSTINLFIDGEKVDHWPRVLIWAAVTIAANVVQRHDRLSCVFEDMINLCWRNTPVDTQIDFLVSHSIHLLPEINRRDKCLFRRSWNAVQHTISKITWSTESISVVHSSANGFIRQCAWPSIRCDTDALCVAIHHLLDQTKQRWLYYAVVREIMERLCLRYIKGENMPHNYYTISNYNATNQLGISRMDIQNQAFVCKSETLNTHVELDDMLSHIVKEMLSRRHSFFIPFDVFDRINIHSPISRSQLTTEQMMVIEILRRGRCKLLFLDGRTGCGKTTVLMMFIFALRTVVPTTKCLILSMTPCVRTNEMCDNVFVVTRTIHWLIEKCTHNKTLSIVQDANVIIFDNISNVDSNLFQKMILCCYRKTARLDLLCFCGDIFPMVNYYQQHNVAYPFVDIVSSSANQYDCQTVSIVSLQQIVRGCTQIRNIVHSLRTRGTADFLQQQVTVQKYNTDIFLTLMNGLFAEKNANIGIINTRLHGDCGVRTLNDLLHAHRQLSGQQGEVLQLNTGSMYVGDKVLCVKSIPTLGKVYLRRGDCVTVRHIEADVITVEKNKQKHRVLATNAKTAFVIDCVILPWHVYGREFSTLVLLVENNKKQSKAFYYNLISRCLHHLYIFTHDDNTVLQLLEQAQCHPESINIWRYSNLCNVSLNAKQ